MNDLGRLEGRKAALDQWQQEVVQIEEIIQRSHDLVQQDLTFAERQEVVRNMVQDVVVTTEEDEAGKRSVRATARFKFVLPAHEGREAVVALKSDEISGPCVATLIQALVIHSR